MRRDLAVRYLTKSTLSQGQVAGLLGFADPKSFQRAFKSWTGKPPEGFARNSRPKQSCTTQQSQAPLGLLALIRHFAKVPSAAQGAISPDRRGEHVALCPAQL